MKQIGDKALPTRRNKIIQCYCEWKYRTPRIIDPATVDEYKRRNKEMIAASNKEMNTATNMEMNAATNAEIDGTIQINDIHENTCDNNNDNKLTFYQM